MTNANAVAVAVAHQVRSVVPLTPFQSGKRGKRRKEIGDGKKQGKENPNERP